MRKHATKWHWQAGAALVVLAVSAGILGLFLANSSVEAVPPPFNADATTDVSDSEHLANANIESTFTVGDDPWPAAMYADQVSFIPQDWGVAAGGDLPIGALLGSLGADATLGWFNNPCNSYLRVDFDELMNASINTSDTVTFDEQFLDSDVNGIPDGADRYPDFLKTLFPGLTPRARMIGVTNIGISISLNFLIFEPGTSLPGLPSFEDSRGYVTVSVLNNPTAPLVANQITDNCPPLGTSTVNYGLSLDNPDTAEDESGYPWRTNPQYGGTYTFYGYATSVRDADSDGIDNGLDTCPHIQNAGDPRVGYSGDDDNDGLDNACDPTPATKTLDPDGDLFPNRQDNCPLIDNEDQLDTDADGIGDVCDQDDWNADGDTNDPGEPTGFALDTPNGDFVETWFETEVDIEGPAPGEETATPTPTPTATVGATGTATATGTPTPEGTATPTTVAGEGCAPVIPGTYNGLVRLNGVPAPAGYEVTATIDGTEWGSTIVSGGRYALDVPQKLPAAEPCFAGGTITFTIDGGVCEPTEEWASGLHDVDLSCAPAATVTVVPPATPPPATPPPATPVVTPAKPPVTGSGGLGGDQGLPLWAMVVIGWAGLTALAGFGTLATRIAKR